MHSFLAHTAMPRDTQTLFMCATTSSPHHLLYSSLPAAHSPPTHYTPYNPALPKSPAPRTRPHRPHAPEDASSSTPCRNRQSECIPSRILYMPLPDTYQCACIPVYPPSSRSYPLTLPTCFALIDTLIYYYIILIPNYHSHSSRRSNSSLSRSSVASGNTTAPFATISRFASFAVHFFDRFFGSGGAIAAGNSNPAPSQYHVGGYAYAAALVASWVWVVPVCCTVRLVVVDSVDHAAAFRQ